MAQPFKSALKRGATYTLALEATEGSIAGASIRAVLKEGRQLPSRTGYVPPGDDAEDVAEFTAVAVDHVDADDNTSGPGWHLTLSATQTAALTPGGVYFTDARVTLSGGSVSVTEPVQLTAEERVTEPA